MSQQTWDYAVIHATIQTLRGQAAQIEGQNEALDASLGKGAATWQGDASDMWATEQRTLNQHGQEFQQAIVSYINAVEEATNHSQHQEQINAASFG